ncbi:MAG: hypothetical protein NTV79_08715 [Candidatus Aureabacteria bacterium]|nr:hypothetical protein [Candidatus Auribacterota bacterium]
MNARMKAILKSKRAARRRLASLSFTEKVALLEKLRDRNLAIANNPRFGQLLEARRNQARQGRALSFDPSRYQTEDGAAMSVKAVREKSAEYKGRKKPKA